MSHTAKPVFYGEECDFAYTVRGYCVQPRTQKQGSRFELSPQFECHMARTSKNAKKCRQPLRSSYSAHMHGRSAIRFAPLRPCMMRATDSTKFSGGIHPRPWPRTRLATYSHS